MTQSNDKPYNQEDYYNYFGYNHQNGWLYFIQDMEGQSTIGGEKVISAFTNKPDSILDCIVLGYALEGGTIFKTEVDKYNKMFRLKTPIHYSECYKILKRFKNGDECWSAMNYDENCSLFNDKESKGVYILDSIIPILQKKKSNKLVCWTSSLTHYSKNNDEFGIRVEPKSSIDFKYMRASEGAKLKTTLGNTRLAFGMITTDKSLVEKLESDPVQNMVEEILLEFKLYPEYHPKNLLKQLKEAKDIESLGTIKNLSVDLGENPLYKKNGSCSSDVGKKLFLQIGFSNKEYLEGLFNKRDSLTESDLLRFNSEYQAPYEIASVLLNKPKSFASLVCKRLLGCLN